MIVECFGEGVYLIDNDPYVCKKGHRQKGPRAVSIVDQNGSRIAAIGPLCLQCLDELLTRECGNVRERQPGDPK